MAVNVNYRQLFSDAQRKQAMADALAEKAVTPQQHQHGRIVSDTGAADAIGSLGTALMARRTDKKAKAMTTQAEDARRQAQAQALAGMQGGQMEGTGQAPMNPYEAAQHASEAGVDPALIAAYMKSKAPQTPVGVSYGEKLVDPVTGEMIADNPRNAATDTTNVPGSLQELKAINDDRASRGEPPMKPEEYLAQRRGASADSQLYAQYLQGLPEGVQPLPMDQFLIQFRGGVTGAQTRAKETTEINVEAQADLPRIQQNADQAIKAIDALIAHPGFAGIFGKSGMLQPQMVPGTDWADANALLQQVQGKTFLEAFQTLKGGGQITELEGTKAEQAIARLGRAQSDEAAKLALLELKEIAQIGVERAKQKATMGVPQGSNLPPIIPNSSPAQAQHTSDPLGLR